MPSCAPIALFAALALASTASATISVSYPIASTVCTADQPCGPFTWTIDDTVLPAGADFGSTSVGIYTGSVSQQTLFFDLGTVSDPTQMLTIPADTIPASLGPSGAYYFLRFESKAATDPSTGYPLQAFSAKFTLDGMTGQLSSEASAQINGVILATTSGPARTSGLVKTADTTPVSSSSSVSSASATGIRAAAVRNTTSGIADNSTSTGAALPNVAAGAWTVGILGVAGVAYLAL